MECLIALVALWLVARHLSAGRFTHWRGPRTDGHRRVQADHLWLFHDPAEREEGDDE